MTTDRIAFWLAAILSLGSLVFYLVIAFSYRREPDEQIDAHEDFNLGVPRLRNVNAGFGASLLAAGTSLSTVLVFFLTATPMFGCWLLLCPTMFVLGNYVLYFIYTRVARNGYFAENIGDERGSAGLVPFLVQRLTGSKPVGWIALVLSALNLLAVLSLELIVGVQVLQYMVKGVFGFELSSLLEFAVYGATVALLLGYVFVGGFRASIASDQYQAMAMKIAVVVASIALAVLAIGSGNFANISQIPAKVPFSVVGFFAMNVTLGNLLVPLAQESSWQRFRAFRSVKGFDAKKGMLNAIFQSGWLWFLIIFISFMLFIVTGSSERANLGSITGCFDRIKSLDRAWFPLFIFPLIVVSALSAMYSTADTCVSAVLYLIEFGRKDATAARHAHSVPDATILDSKYYLAMFAIFVLSLGVYGFVRFLFNPTVLQLVFSVFSNLVVLSPSILLAALIKPLPNGEKDWRRMLCVALSILMGCAGYWSASIAAMIKGGSYLWMSQAAIVIGLILAILPTLPVMLLGNKEGKVKANVA